MSRRLTVVARAFCVIQIITGAICAAGEMNPYDSQVADKTEQLKTGTSKERALAAEALGYLRAYSSADALAEALGDDSAEVRREAATALAWCGARSEVAPLLDLLDDSDWVVRQAAWVALTNLTGMEWPYDALGEDGERRGQVDVWRKWWEKASKKFPCADIIQLVSTKDDEKRLRGVRALGALGGEGATEIILEVLGPFRHRDYDTVNRLQKHLVQSCVRSLGRLRGGEAFGVLIDLLKTEGWARYAADALGDFGSPKAIIPLTQGYPKFARDLTIDRLEGPEICPEDDSFHGDNTQDKMHETPFAIISALARLSFDNPDDVAALRKITPIIVGNLPSDWDSGVFYDLMAEQLITAYLVGKAELREAVCEAAFESAANSSKWVYWESKPVTYKGLTHREVFAQLAVWMFGDVPDMAAWLTTFCRDERYVPRLIELLEHDNGWVRINAAKALMFIGDRRAVEPIATLLMASKTEAEWGFSGALEHSEYDDPTPRWREAFIRALGRLGAKEYDGLLISILGDGRNVIDIQHAAALALDELGSSDALTALRYAEVNHPFHSVRMVAREAIWRRGMAQIELPTRRNTPIDESSKVTSAPASGAEPEAIVFIKGSKRVRSDFNGQAGVDPWRQTYSVTNSGPTMKIGRNLYILRPASEEGKVTALTSFKSGFVADCEVSWDGKKIIFSRRLNDEDRHYSKVPYQKATLKDPSLPLLGWKDDPWWHIWEINVDGSGLKQITFGPYHDVAPVYLGDGRIVLCSTRVGLRDEYHGYPGPGLSVMNADGTDICNIGFHFGTDRDPAILNDGRIIFSRLDNFYSRLKTEVNIQAIFPDGTRNIGFYGPERRAFWRQVNMKNAAWTLRESYDDNPDNRNRVLRLSQPQPFGADRAICASSSGLAIMGPGHNRETMIPHDRKMAITSPFPLDERRIICAASIKQFDIDGRIVTAGTKEFDRLEKGEELFRSATNIDLGLYIMDAETGEMTLLYNDPATADFEPRPIMPRRRPILLAEGTPTRNRSYTAKLFCHSAKISRVGRVRSRGKWVRLVEGRPFVARHETQQNRKSVLWKNHGGTNARVLGTIPLAADGSFFMEVPADRLLQLQVLDSDRRVLGNQLFWMYARPGETRSCIGCHEPRDTAHLPDHFAAAAGVEPVKMLPSGGEFSYRAKAWLKGWLPDESEERNRTARAVKLLGRY